MPQLITPEDAVAELRSFMTDTPWNVSCPQCQDLQDTLHAVLKTAVHPRASSTLHAAHATLAGSTHLQRPFHPDQADTCDFELWMMKDTAALGLAGVPSILAWGPAHTPGLAHPENWNDCPSCSTWHEDRLWARQRLHAAGMDPNAHLGPSDNPPRRTTALDDPHGNRTAGPTPTAPHQ